MGTKEHKETAPDRVTVGIITVSTSRTLAEDQSGNWMSKQAKKEGHTVVHHTLVPDNLSLIRDTLLRVIRDFSPNVVLITGGTGISPKDLTIEAVRPLFSKELTAFGVLFAQLSYEEIDAAALLSRATAGIIYNSVVFSMPGSLKACKLACKNLIFPEMGHLVRHMRE
ncbi:MAG: molybdenum cofactor biosynthesis protein B [Pseudomonadota bacterium]